MDSWLGMFGGLVGVTFLAVNWLKAHWKWIDGKEEGAALVLPVVLALGAKLAGCTAAFAAMGWGKLALGAAVAGIMAQVGHDKVWDPVMQPLWAKMVDWFHEKYSG